MTDPEYKVISEAIKDLRAKLILAVDDHTRDTLKIIENKEK